MSFQTHCTDNKLTIFRMNMTPQKFTSTSQNLEVPKDLTAAMDGVKYDKLSGHIIRRKPRTSIRNRLRFFLNFLMFERSVDGERSSKVVSECNALAILVFNTEFGCLFTNSLPNLCTN